MGRQQVLYSGDRKFLCVLEEQTLRTRIGGPDVMIGQLDRMLAVMSLPRVSVGIIPATGLRHCIAQGSFWMFDETMVQVETTSAGLEITQPREILLYGRAFALLQKSAVYGKPARELVARALVHWQARDHEKA